MAHAIRIHAYGGPEVLKWEEVTVGEPGPGEVRLRQTAVGLNYIDTYHRTGLYKLAAFPAVIGMEGAGRVVAVGPRVSDLAVGDRVAYAGVLGGYAEERLIAADRLVKLPAAIDDETAAAIMLQGMTARYLLRETYPCTADTVLLFHAAAGGVGHIACQWGRAIGATIIGTVGSPEKAVLAKEYGCTHVINYRTEDYVARVKEITAGKGCDVVYDGIGKDTFPSSLDCLRPKGMWVCFRQRIGPRTAVRHGDPFDQGIALCHATHAYDLRRPPRRSLGQRRRAVSDGGERRDQGRSGAHISSARGCSCTPRARSARDDGLGGAVGVIWHPRSRAMVSLR